MKRFIGMLLVLVMVLTCAAAYASEGKYFVNTQTDPLNVRDAAGGGAVIGHLSKGSTIDVQLFTKGWAKIGEGKYVWAEYLAPYSGNKTPTAPRSTLQKASVAGTTVMYVKKSMSGWLNVRAGESVNSEHLGKLYAGNKVYVAEDRGEWLKIVYDGHYAYVMASFVTKSNPPETMPNETGAYKVIEGRLKVRKGPSAEAEVLDILDNGWTVRLIENQGEWSMVYYHGEKIGYVMSRYITAN